jgi:hypothetical protein
MTPVQFLSQKRRTLAAPHVSHTTREERCAHNTLSSAKQSWNSFSAKSCASSYAVITPQQQAGFERKKLAAARIARRRFSARASCFSASASSSTASRACRAAWQRRNARCRRVFRGIPADTRAQRLAGGSKSKKALFCCARTQCAARKTTSRAAALADLKRSARAGAGAPPRAANGERADAPRGGAGARTNEGDGRGRRATKRGGARAAAIASIKRRPYF